MNKIAALGLLSLALSACQSSWPAPASAELSDLEDFEVVTSTAVQTADGVGVLLFGDIMVFDSDTDMPLNNIEVEILSNWSGIYTIPENAIKLVDGVSAPADVVDGTTPVADYCDVNPADGYIDADADDWCSWWWDTESQAYYQFGGDYAMGPDNYQPTYMIGTTDNRGVLRFYLYIDAMPYDAENATFSDAAVWFSIGVDTLTVAINAGE